MAATTVLTQLDPQAPEFQMSSSLNPNAKEFQPVMLDPSSLTLRSEAAEFIPMAGGWATIQAAAEAYQNKQKRQMPFATDEEWDMRIRKREKEVETIKSLQSYRLYIEVFPHDKRGDDDPKTPDPRDRSVSKRMWKWNVEKWRLQLKSRCVYSRAVLLQCREELRMRDDSSPAVVDASSSTAAVASGEASAVAGATEETVAAGVAGLGNSRTSSAQSNETPANHAEGMVTTRKLKTMSIPEQPRTIPSRPSRAEASQKGAPAAGTFQ